MYDKKKKTITDIGGKSYTAFNYMNQGAYLMMDYDKQTESGTVYYIEDGSTLVPVMEGITEIEVHGKYVYLKQLLGKRSEGYYNVYIGNPEEGYGLLAENVKCMEEDNIHFWS